MIVNFGTILQYSLCESKFRNCHKTMKMVFAAKVHQACRMILFRTLDKGYT